MNTKKLSPPFLIQMTCGDANRQCDVFPHGSFKEVSEDENGVQWVVKNVHAIPTDYPRKRVESKGETKVCPSCNNEFPSDWPFSEWRLAGVTQTSCVRCYEKRYIIHNHGYTRDDYRQTLREELKRELSL